MNRIGTIELTVPRHRSAPFRKLVFESYRRRRDEIVSDYAEEAPRAAEQIDAGFEDAMTVYRPAGGDARLHAHVELHREAQ